MMVKDLSRGTRNVFQYSPQWTDIATFQTGSETIKMSKLTFPRNDMQACVLSLKNA